MENFKKALALDVTYATANNSLGYCHLFKALAPDTAEAEVAPNLQSALTHFNSADGVSGEADGRHVH